MLNVLNLLNLLDLLSGSFLAVSLDLLLSRGMMMVYVHLLTVNLLLDRSLVDYLLLLNRSLLYDFLDVLNGSLVYDFLDVLDLVVFSCRLSGEGLKREDKSHSLVRERSRLSI